MIPGSSKGNTRLCHTSAGPGTCTGCLGPESSTVVGVDPRGSDGQVLKQVDLLAARRGWFAHHVDADCA